MITLSADEFKKKYGETAYNSFGSQPATPKQDFNVAAETVKGLPRAAYDVLVNPALKFAKSAVEAPKDILSGLQNKPIETKPTKGFMGEELNTYQSEFQNKTLPQVASGEKSPLRATAETVGGVLEGAGTVLGGEAALKAVPGVVRGAVGAVKDATAGAKSIAQSTTEQLGSLTKSNKTPEQFIEELVTPKMQKKDLTQAIKTGKVQEGEGLLGDRDVTGAISDLKPIKAEVLKVPGVSSDKTMLENVNAIHDNIGAIADNLINQLEREKTFFSPKEFAGVMNSAKQTLLENPTVVGDAESAATKVITKFERLVKENGYTPSGLLKARKALDKWVRNQKGDKVFSPTTESGVTEAIRVIRKTGNDFLAQIAPNTAVKQLLNTQSTLYRAIDNIAPKAAGEGSNAAQQFIRKNPNLYRGAKYVAGGGALGTGLGLFLGN